ncbi:diphosphomevalonate decarboxylase [Weissella paramesenteroides]|uniref:diphosphomevalonate decarboxylase n=1 Tax=Weissella paramesenteroides TaxID=1249 RepID=UPI00207387FF|nr:diphosphomevalonate decarboxylase [Weissella paramesenteroides]MCM6765626.1 diphosphomevalonate decarboxylase [Weissella paramesenteroides]MCM6766997.1 diphosphomevalonate decarboxylase [Weissella paramesenteroides]MCM6769361.1 diphosphomevalonate decarboxylase [Weissella paramesenteroides]MCM6771239.1 diphosphomevalonate decarboxylase [Weissella paramesenteroides]MCM6779668.1 diphosphomevalonate decarboxylase [Weissella paramesenteroides]
MHYTARAHTNIALLKYWGKVDEALITPTTTSISLTLDEFYTDTTVWFDKSLQSDQLILDGETISGSAAQKVSRFLDVVREMADINDKAYVVSNNHVPTAAGLASSASAFAALAGAASKAAGLNLSVTELSRLARHGSGSATRSIFGGFAKWVPGDDRTSFATPIFEKVDWPIQLLTVVINDQPKKIGSRLGMQHSKNTAPFYDMWVRLANSQVNDMILAIQQHDIVKLGELAEANALQMHAMNTTSVPPFNYLTDKSWQVIMIAQELREQGIPVYATMDAGPNVKLISRPEDTFIIKKELANIVTSSQIIIASPGPGIKVTSGDKI